MKKKKIKYIRYLYTNEDRSLYQAVQREVDLDKESDDLYSNMAIPIVKLPILLKKMYLTSDYSVVKEEIIGG